MAVVTTVGLGSVAAGVVRAGSHVADLRGFFLAIATLRSGGRALVGRRVFGVARVAGHLTVGADAVGRVSPVALLARFLHAITTNGTAGGGRALVGRRVFVLARVARHLPIGAHAVGGFGPVAFFSGFLHPISAL